MRRVGKVAQFMRSDPHAIVMSTASDVASVRVGDVLRFSVDGDESYNRVREGEHRVASADIDTGVIRLFDPVKDRTPTATDLDWIFAYDRDPTWSPYP